MILEEREDHPWLVVCNGLVDGKPSHVSQLLLKTKEFIMTGEYL
jgi:hypothetical protein